MRLSGVLSKLPTSEFKQVDGFLVGKKGDVGQRVDLNSVQVTYSYRCTLCEDVSVFVSKGTISCVFISKQLISIDCVLACDCGANVPVWFLVESYNEIVDQNPEIRILERKDKLSENVRIIDNDEYSEFLDKSERAYRDGLGAGSMVYLRKIFESLTKKSAASAKIDTAKPDGKRKNFKDLLKEVDAKLSIIPKPFTERRYKLYEELSSAMHGDSDEEDSLQKYEACKRLIVGIIENIRANEKAIKDSKEMKSAIDSLGWNKSGGGDR